MKDGDSFDKLTEVATPSRRPRIVIAGEFSAGKTRLLNALLGQKILPSNVTSTSLPPMWLVHREGVPARLDMDGNWHAVDDFGDVKVDSTKYCVVPSTAPILEHFDLIDTPGNSDPNIPPECWERMIGYADLVIWCSNSNQAWRQSEKSVWSDMPDRLKQHSVIVLTHADQIPDERSRGKVKRRVERDAKDFFASFEMLSSLNTDEVAAFADRMIQSVSGIEDLTGVAAPEQAIIPDFTIKVAPLAEIEPLPVTKKPSKGAIKPRRVKSKAMGIEAVDISTPKLPLLNVLDTHDGVNDQAAEAFDENKLIAMPFKSETAFLALTSEPESAISAATTGAARKIWGRLRQQTDMTNLDAVLASIDTLIREIDSQDEFELFDDVPNAPMQNKA